MVGIKILRRLGEAIDRRYLKKAGVTEIPGSKHQLLLICFHRYQGKKPVELTDGVVVQPGDQVGEFHLSNIRITQLAAEPAERSLEWRLIDLIKTEFATLSEACATGKIPLEIKAFYGVNVLAAGAKRLGFTLVPVPKGWNRWWLGFWESMLRLVFYSFKTKKKASLKRTMDPYEIWITRAKIIERYTERPVSETRD